jgi:hypothetical protein
MRSLADGQRQFAQALLDPGAAVPDGLCGPDGMPARNRFAVYRNNVVVGLIDALRCSFPATCRIIGEEFFHQMAREYVLAEPPTSPILLGYGESFPDFVGRFGPAGSLPYISDIARIERAWIEAYHAREAIPLDPHVLAAIPRDRAADIRFSMHPSLRLVRSQFPALTIWRMNVADGIPAPVDLDAGGEDALIVRPLAEVEVRSVPPGGAEFVIALTGGSPLMDATSAALSASGCFDLAANLSALIEAGMLVGYHLDQDGI